MWTESLKGKVVALILAIVVLASISYFAYRSGQQSEHPVVWQSDLMLKLYGRRMYPIDFPVSCPGPGPNGSGGRYLGIIQADFNLTNGKWKVVRNDPGKWPYCGK